MSVPTSRSHAEALDAGNPLASFRDRFVIDDESLIYLDGNSLGMLPRESRDRVVDVLDRGWGARLIRSWTDEWADLPTRTGDLISTGLLGGSTGECVVDGSTTVALFKVIAAVLDAQRPAGRDVVLIERDNFPTDRYLVESFAARHGVEIRWVPDRGAAGVRVDDVADLLDGRVAMAVLSAVDYRSAAIADVEPITAAVAGAGAVTCWDLCHAVGAVPIDVRASGIELAVGCTYKYLNGGPGAPAFTYVSSTAQERLTQPIWGWWSRDRMFDMEQGYVPADGVRQWLTGTPSILSLAAVEPSVAMVVEAGIDAIRTASVALTGYAVDLYDTWLGPLGVGLATPRDPDRRGGHVTVTHPDAERLSGDLTAAGVVPDFRRPDGIRLGLSPLTTRFVDVYDGLAVLRDLLDGARATA